MDRVHNVLALTVAATGGQSAGMTRAAEMLARPDMPRGPSAAEGAGSFSSILGSAIESVHRAQSEASMLQKGYQSADPEVGLEQTMIAMNKASLSFQMLTQARNKVVTAYNEIMNMPV